MIYYIEIALLQPIEFIGHISIAPYRQKFQWVRLRENYFVQSPKVKKLKVIGIFFCFVKSALGMNKAEVWNHTSQLCFLSIRNSNPKSAF